MTMGGIAFYMDFWAYDYYISVAMSGMGWERLQLSLKFLENVLMFSAFWTLHWIDRLLARIYALFV